MTLVTTRDLIGPLLEVGLAAGLALAGVVVVWRSRWRRGGVVLGVLLAVAGAGVLGRLVTERSRSADFSREIGTQAQLSSLNSAMLMLQITEPETRLLGDAGLLERIRTDGSFSMSGYLRPDDAGQPCDHWDRPLFMVRRPDGRRIWSSSGRDGLAGNADDL